MTTSERSLLSLIESASTRAPAKRASTPFTELITSNVAHEQFNWFFAFETCHRNHLRLRVM